jgi:Ca2+-binding EF-hand superfamily protein
MTLPALLLALSAATAAAQPNLPAYDPGTAFTESDRNQDGAVDHEEFVDRITEVFFIADRDKDGSLTTVEVDAALVRTGNLDAADTNKDGALDLNEFRRARVIDFEQADVDRDGTLSLTEVVDAYRPKGK